MYLNKVLTKYTKLKVIITKHDIAMAVYTYTKSKSNLELTEEDSNKETRMSKTDFSKPYSFNRGFDFSFGKPKLSLGGGI